MFRVSGTLSAKTMLKKGISQKGSWKIATFLLKKTRQKKPIQIPLVARGYWAGVIDEMLTGEKINVEFYIESRKYNGRYYPNCVVTNIVRKEKRIKKADELNFRKSKNYDNLIIKDTNLFNQINNDI